MDKTYLFGMSRDGTLGLLLGFGVTAFAVIFIFWAQAAAQHLRDQWGRKTWRAKK